jgi:uncharacterized protein YecE (DUF72 family)
MQSPSRSCPSIAALIRSMPTSPSSLAATLAACVAEAEAWPNQRAEVPPDRPTSAGASLIGCAGWSIARPVAAAFPGEGSHLERYARILPAVEINSSFYRPHQPQTYARWAASVPADFLFSVKLPKTISHERGLRDSDEPLARFSDEVQCLGDKLGCILVQLPPSLACDVASADRFFAGLRARFACMLACEARHASWFADAASALLMRHDITRVIADPAPGQPGAHVPTSATVYLRLHGSPQRYYSAYEAALLAQVAQALRAWRAAGRNAWCIFDNTAGGAALPDALQLLQLL